MGPRERKFKSLSQIELDGRSSFCFKLRIRPIGFDNVPLIPRTELRGGIAGSQSNLDIFSDAPSFLKIYDENKQIEKELELNPSESENQRSQGHLTSIGWSENTIPLNPNNQQPQGINGLERQSE